jgi:hypothetical protein
MAQEKAGGSRKTPEKLLVSETASFLGLFYWEDLAMVVKKKSSRKVVRKKKALKVKKGKKKLIKRKGAKVSKRKIPYEIIKVAKLPDEVLNKIKEGSKSVSEGYYSTHGRFRRWFDWSNEICKTIEEMRALDYETMHLTKSRIPQEFHCYIETLTDIHRVIRNQLLQVKAKANDIRRSIHHYHGDDLNITAEEMG